MKFTVSPFFAFIAVSFSSLTVAHASTDQFQVCGHKPNLRNFYFRQIQGAFSSGNFQLPEVTQALSQAGQVAIDHYEAGTFSSPYDVAPQMSCICISLQLGTRSANDQLQFRMTGGSPGAECLPRSHNGPAPMIRIH